MIGILTEQFPAHAGLFAGWSTPPTDPNMQTIRFRQTRRRRLPDLSIQTWHMMHMAPMAARPEAAPAKVPAGVKRSISRTLFAS